MLVYLFVCSLTRSLGEEGEGVNSPTAAGATTSENFGTGREQSQPVMKMSGGGVKQQKSKKTGILEPLIGNQSSLSTTQKQRKEKFRSYEIYRKQSERIYQRLREAKSQRGFRNEDDMMNFFRVLESSDTTIAR